MTMNISNLFASAFVLKDIAAKITKAITTYRRSDKLNEVLFYGASKDDKNKELGLNNLFCVYYLLVHAGQTVDVCIPSLQSETISNCLINVHHKNNAKVRIIIHKNQEINSKYLRNCGIEVKVSSYDVRLEHEFILIDAVDCCKGALAIIGSLDYEVNHVNCRQDSTMLTSEGAVIFTLKREFDRIWNTVATKTAS